MPRGPPSRAGPALPAAGRAAGLAPERLEGRGPPAARPRGSNPETNFSGQRTLPAPAALSGGGLLSLPRVGADRPEDRPGDSEAHAGRPGPEELSWRCRLARGPPRHNKSGRAPGRGVARRPARLRDLGGGRPGRPAADRSPSLGGWRAATDAPLLSLAFCLLCGGEVLF